MDNSEQSARIIALEQQVEQLETAALEQHNRIGWLEKALGIGVTAGEIARAQGSYTTAMPPAVREQ